MCALAQAKKRRESKSRLTSRTIKCWLSRGKAIELKTKPVYNNRQASKSLAIDPIMIHIHNNQEWVTASRSMMDRSSRLVGRYVSDRQ
ncbi:hypothetical protein RRG08_024966 [Elysia crispata]|uniref:Uncharacterized protein n=1 Tax=Elysia crispata TaxID=231223 RepID=A0AAE1ASI7_9GAST|nr:hypothetical protein RRG08_024966 [Elysia crispata]